MRPRHVPARIAPLFAALLLTTHLAGGAAGSTPPWFHESDLADAFLGTSVAPAGDVNNDGYDDVIVGAPGARLALVFHGTAAGLSPTPAWQITGPADTEFGTDVASAGDVNGDGYDDVIVGAPALAPAVVGQALVYYGSASGLGTTAAWTVSGSESLGHRIGSGDLNGDGFDDVVVAEPRLDSLYTDQGRVRLYFGSASGLSATHDWEYTAHTNAAAGSCIAAGDVNGDSFDDLIFGLPEIDSPGGNGGWVIISYGSPDGPGGISWYVEGEQNSRYLGHSCGTGDFNGDTVADVIVGDRKGAVEAYFGGAGGPPYAPDWTVSGFTEEWNSPLGTVVGSVDFNGDGFDDVIVGDVLWTDSIERGSVHVFHGGPAGPGSSADKLIVGDQDGAQFGYDVGGAGDTNSDGFEGILVGQRRFASPETDEGRALLYDMFSDTCADGDSDGFGLVADSSCPEPDTADCDDNDPQCNTDCNDIDQDGLCGTIDCNDESITCQEDCFDGDSDGAGDCGDNCPLVANPDQADDDSDGLGDACDPCFGYDQDGDGFCEGTDNCPLVSNPGQADEDSDGRGDDCDDCPFGPDLDNDGLCDSVDTCPVEPVQPDVVRLNAPLATGGNVIAHQSSADGQWAVYLADQETNGLFELYSVRATGGPVTKLNAPLVSGGEIFDFEIAGDSRNVVYLADGMVDEREDLFSVPIQGGGVRRLTASADNGIDEWAIAPDGSWTVYRSQADLFSVETTGGAPVPLSIAGYHEVQPGFKISPDSNYVVYRDGDPAFIEMSLFVMAIDGSWGTAFISDIVFVRDAWFTPDSSRLVYQSETTMDYFLESRPVTGGPEVLHCMKIPGGGLDTTLGITPNPLGTIRLLHTCDWPEQLVSEPVEGGTSVGLDDAPVGLEDFSPDGSYVIYRSGDDLESVETAGGTPVTLNGPLTQHGEIVLARVTADSQTVVYRADQQQDEVFELYSVPVTGGAVTRLNGDLGNQQDVVEFGLSPVSDTVVYLADETTRAQFELFAVSAAGGAVQTLNDALPSKGDVASFSIGLDGGRVFYRADQDSNNTDELYSADLYADADEDGVPGRCDCDSGDPAVWSLPGEVTGLTLSHVPGTTSLSWTAPTVLGSGGVLYDTLRTDRPDGFEPGSGATVIEIESDGADTSSTDTDDPAGGFYYVVRAGNACGEGTIGCSRDPIGPCP